LHDVSCHEKNSMMATRK